ncbi:MAG: DUF255 domain-containing protein [Planctomycetota bacterium]
MTDPVAWLEFEPKTLERAKAADRPVVMLLTVPWCSHCKDLVQSTFGDEKLAATIRDGFLAVHVDAERRPDVNERYGTGGWPTIAYLTPDGELIANDSYLSPQELLQRLQRVQTVWREQRDELKKGLQELWSHKSNAPVQRGRLSRQMIDDVAEAIYEKLDHRYGGWGTGAKFPHAEALDFALVQWQKRGDERMREVVTLTLDRMQDSALHDTIDGGFFRFSKTPDWRSPNFEKLLDVNVRILRAYLEAYQVFGKESYRATAEGIVRWMLTFLREPETKAFYGSQDADADYYNLDAEGRSRREPPTVDRTIHCHGNAMAVSGLLKASVVLAKPEWREVALQVLQFLRTELFDGRDVFHYWDGTYHLPGMLADQAYLIRALIDASQLTGDADLLLLAEAIAEQAIARQKAPGGGFFDILNDPRQSGSMRRRNRSILENSIMAEALVRLSYLSRRPEFHAEAITTLEAFATDYKEYGYYVAGFGRAVDLVFYEPLVLTIVGDRDSEAAQALRSTALSRYVPSRMVQMLDPRFDPILIGRSGYKVEAQPVVYVTLGKSTRQTVRTPEQLAAAIEQIGWERRSRSG